MAARERLVKGACLYAERSSPRRPEPPSYYRKGDCQSTTQAHYPNSHTCRVYTPSDPVLHSCKVGSTVSWWRSLGPTHLGRSNFPSWERDRRVHERAKEAIYGSHLRKPDDFQVMPCRMSHLRSSFSLCRILPSIEISFEATNEDVQGRLW